MKLIIAAALALTATAASADHRYHCSTHVTSWHESTYVRIDETRDCRGRLIDYRRVDMTPTHQRHRTHRVERHHKSDNDAALLILGVILGGVLTQNGK